MQGKGHYAEIYLRQDELRASIDITNPPSHTFATRFN
jgi:hypothetical protein